MHDKFYSVELACDLIMIRLCMKVIGVLVDRQALSGKIEIVYQSCSRYAVRLDHATFLLPKLTIIT